MKPTILHIYKDYFPPVIGGIEKSINLMCQGLKDEFEIKVLISARGFNLRQRQYELDGVKIIEAPCLGRFYSAPLCHSFPLLLKRLKAHILHFHFPNPTGEISYLLMRPKGKVVVTYHSDIVRQKLALKLYRSYVFKFLEAADIILPTSANYIQHSEFLRQFKEKCEVMPLGINLEEFKLTERIKKRAEEIRKEIQPPIIIFVGVLRYYKGLQYLLEAMQKTPARLIIIGSGAEEPKLLQYAQKLGLKDAVIFTGEVSDEEKVCYLYASDVFCLPSHLPSEAYGISQIEAMACGLPVVSTALDTGVTFVNKDGESGIIVPPANSQALAAALNSILKDETKLRQLAAGAKQRAQQLFSSKIMLEHLRQIYLQLM